VFGRRRWRTPWSSGEPQAVDTPTVEVVPPGVTASAGQGTAPGAPSSRLGDPPWSTGSPGSGDPPSTRVIRIPASVGIGHPGDSPPACGAAAATRPRSPSASTAREAPSEHAPPWQQAGSDGRGAIAPAVIAVVIVCALLGGLAALAATLGRGTSSNPSPAASIAPTGVTAPSGRAGTGVRGADANHSGHRHGAGGRGSAAPLHAPTRATARKPAAKRPSAGRTARRADGGKHHQAPRPHASAEARTPED
jgi:hypothetical protein